MDGQKVFGKKNLCYTELSDYISFRSIGKDPIYKRFNSVLGVVQRQVENEFQHFLAEPFYDAINDRIEWHIEMWKEHPICLTELSGEEYNFYNDIKTRTINAYESAKQKSKKEDFDIISSVLFSLDDKRIFCCDGKVYFVAWGMAPNLQKHEGLGAVVHEVAFRPEFNVTFDAGEHGRLVKKTVHQLKYKKGFVLTENNVPQIDVEPDWQFTGWNQNPIGMKVESDLVFTASYDAKNEEPSVVDEEPEYFTCTFVAPNGNIEGTNRITKLAGTHIEQYEIPKIVPQKGYEFKGWNVSPLNLVVDEDKIFSAQFSKIPWYKRFWTWLLAFLRCKWLWRILLFILLLLLALLLLRNCKGCTNTHNAINQRDSVWIADDPNCNRGGIYNPGNPYRPEPTPPDYNEILPPQQGVLPPTDGTPEIIPGNPSIIANRLNILMENEEKSILELAQKFKEKYPSDAYQVIYYDDVVKRMQIDIPPEEREQLKQSLPQEFAPEFSLFVFDEALFETRDLPNDPAVNDSEKAWYLNAINAPQAWEISKGTEQITIAVVDNGFSLSHPELKNKVVQPYNVWTHSATVFPQTIDHGTHVAGIALAVANNGKGLSGIAPNCKFMPIQVADGNGIMTTTSVLDGILYALYQGADVVNVSLGNTFEGLNQFGENVQKDFIFNHFKEEERLWRHIMRIAETHNTSIVVAAGNDDVLAGIEPLQRPESFIVVSAVDKNLNHLQKANFSNFGEFSTISAPGVDIYSSIGSNDYQTMSGTSMAAPIVSGAVALMKSLNDTIGNEQIICVLKNTGVSVNGNVGKMLQLDKALQKVKSGEITDCTPTPTSGDVQVLLAWETYNDLDLIVVDPYDEIVFFQNRRVSSGGYLEIDMNVRNYHSRTPIENIYWPQGQAPSGTYTVFALYYKAHQNCANNFRVTVKYGDKTEEYTGTLSREKEKVKVCTFTLNGDNPPPQTSENELEKLLKERERIEREIDNNNRENNQLNQDLDNINSKIRRIKNN